MTRFDLEPSWLLERRDDALHVIAGPDEHHVLTELAPETLDRCARWALDRSATAGETPELDEVCEYLMLVGAVRPVASFPLAWRSVGSGAAVGALSERLGDLAGPIEGFTVIVRTDGSLTELAESVVKAPARCGMLLDLAAHHTVSIGPVFLSRHTACPACYAARIRARWGDEIMPPVPSVTNRPGLIADLLAIQLELVRRGVSRLIDRTMVWNLETGASRAESLMRLPGCLGCDQAGPPADGRIEFGWVGSSP